MSDTDAGRGKTRSEMPPVSTGQDRLGQLGARIGPYRLLSVLGEGGFAVVYLAEQEAPVHRRVALKINKVGMDTKRVLARFEAERQALAMMDHPNIARVLDAGAAETGRPYFVMELVHGEPITHYCDRHRLGIEERLGLFLDVCHAVQHAHQKGVIHRDIKPSNVLVTIIDERPVPKVIDFGVAKATAQPLTERTLFTEQGQLIGTPEYMSPEQAEMSALDVDTRTDVYSLGVLLYELLTGTLPFDPQTLRRAGFAEIQRIIREEEAPRPSTKLSGLGADSERHARRRQADARTLRRQLRGDLDWITMKALDKDRGRRYATAAQLGDDVERFLNEEPVDAGPPGAVYRLRKLLRRHRRAVAVAAGMVTLLVAGSITSTSLYLSAESARREAASQERTARRQAAKARDAEAVAGRQRDIAEDERRRAGEQARTAKGRLAEALILQASLLGRTGRWAESKPKFRAAYSLLAELAAPLYPYDVALADALRSAPLPLYTIGGPKTFCLAVSPDGRLLAGGDSSGQLTTWDTRTGRKLWAASCPAPAENIRFSLDGRIVAACSPEDVRVWNAPTGQSVVQLPRRHEAFDCAFSPDANALFTFGTSVSSFALPSGKALRTYTYTEFSKTDAARALPRRFVASRAVGSPTLYHLATGRRQRFAWQNAMIYAFDVSPNGKQIASAGTDRVIRMWDIQSGDLVSELPGHEDEVMRLQFLPCGDRLVSVGRDGLAKVWHVPSGRTGQTFVYNELSEDIEALAVSRNGQYAFVGGHGRSIQAWRILPEPDCFMLTSPDEPVREVAVSGDGRVAVFGGARGTIEAWDIPSRQRLWSLSGCTARVLAAAFGPGGRYLYVGAVDGRIYTWDLTTGRLLKTHTASSRPVSALAVSPDGKLLASGSRDRRATVYRLPGFTVVSACSAHEDDIYGLAFLGDGGSVVSCDRAGKIIVWDARNGEVLRRYSSHSNTSLDSDGSTILLGGRYGNVRILDVGSGKGVCSVGRHNAIVVDVSLIRGATVGLSGGRDHTLRLWDIANRSELWNLGVRGISAAAASRDGRYVLAAVPGGRYPTHFLLAPITGGDVTGKVTLWDIGFPEQCRRLQPAGAAAMKKLRSRSGDASALKTLGEWYALRRADDWAVELLEEAREHGEEVSCVLLGRCYWRDGRLREAADMFRQASARNELPETYLQMCVNSLDSRTRDAGEQ